MLNAAHLRDTNKMEPLYKAAVEKTNKMMENIWRRREKEPVPFGTHLF